MAEATVARVNSEISVLRRRTSSGGGASGVPSQESGGVSNSGRTKGLGDVTGTQPDDKLRDAEGGEAVTFVFGGSPARVSEPLDDSGSGVLSDPLATLSATSGEEDSEEDVGGGSTTDDDSGGGCDHGYEDEEYSDVDDDGIDGVGGGSFGGSKGMAGEGGGAPRSQGASWAASGPGRWAVRGVAEAWAEQRSMSATVGAAIGSFDVASGVILDNLQARLNEGAAMARMPITGWDTPDSCPTSPQPKPQQKQRCKGSAKVDKGRGKDVKLVATHAGEFRCAAVCGSAVWLADRSGRIEIRSRAPKFQASGGKVRCASPASATVSALHISSPCPLPSPHVSLLVSCVVAVLPSYVPSSGPLLPAPDLSSGLGVV